MSVGITRTLEWGTPVLYLRAPDAVLFELPPTLSGVSYRERVISPAANQHQSALTSAMLPSPPTARSLMVPEKVALSPNASPGHPTDVSITSQAAPTKFSARQRGMTRRTLIGAAASILLLGGSGTAALLLTQHKPFQQQVTTGIHITRIQVGTGFDATAGVVTGEKAIFHRGEQIYIVFTVATQEAQAQVVIKLFYQGALEATSQPLIPQAGNHPYTNPIEVSQTGTYKVEVDYNGTREATITFNVAA